MSDKSLPELMYRFRRQSPGTAKHYLLAELVNARIRRAETAERVAEAWLAWCDSGNVDGTWDAYMQALAAYNAAREAVRKLEEQT